MERRLTNMQSLLNQNSIKVAEELLGNFLCRKIRGKVYKFKITETEAYEGFKDKASHAYRGRTKSNEPMWAEAGTIYVYLIYGMHYMLNIVCGVKGHPSAVLIRGVEGVKGPGRVSKKIFIDKSLNNKKLGKDSGLWLEKNYNKEKIIMKKGPRVGIKYAGDYWSKKPYRFILDSDC